MWYDDYYDNDDCEDKFVVDNYDDDEGKFFKWYDSYRARKA